MLLDPSYQIQLTSPLIILFLAIYATPTKKSLQYLMTMLSELSIKKSFLSNLYIILKLIKNKIFI